MWLENSDILNKEISVEDIMRKIRENAKRREISGDCTKAKLMAASEPFSGQDNSNDETHKDLAYINSNWDIQNNSYFITTHRHVIGKAIIKARELVHGEVRRYVDPINKKQNGFNSSIVRILNEVTKTQTRILSEIERQVRTVIATMNEDIENRVWLADILDKRISQSMKTTYESSDWQNSRINYFAFEERFRGSRADIEGRQSAFLPYFAGCKNVLDIGCGRGEFLELLREHEISGHGIDIDEDMVNFCRSDGLDVERIDAVSHLDKLEEKSLDGIFMDQVVEHVEPEYLMRMLDLCYRKLTVGSTIIVETVNPLSFFSFANFYIDMSHKRPLHPETMRFLMNVAGFREVETHFLAHVPDELRLKEIKIDSGTEERDIKVLNTHNHNIEILNNVLFGAQDYAIIGRKRNL
jgi:2-polyprenyl-3-methyl-5-hydroxy-6-metoxy-1,4-benzoquinol methylase